MLVAGLHQPLSVGPVVMVARPAQVLLVLIVLAGPATNAFDGLGGYSLLLGLGSYLPKCGSDVDLPARSLLVYFFPGTLGKKARCIHTHF